MCCNYYNSHTRQFTERGCNCSFSIDGQINSLDFAYKSASILGSTTPAAQKCARCDEFRPVKSITGQQTAEEINAVGFFKEKAAERRHNGAIKVRV